MLQFIVQDGYLIRVSRNESNAVSIDAVSIENSQAYTLHSEWDRINTGVLNALLTESESQHIKTTTSNSSLIFTHTHVLPNGLELRPQLLELPLADKQLSVLTMITELCHVNATLHADIKRISKESELRSKYMEDIVQEKEQYQDTMIKKVSAIIDDRNARITAAALKVKKEPTE